MAPILGYWDIRGLAEPIRLLLRYLGSEFEEKLYKTGPAWVSEKFGLGLDFPNLPYYIDGDLKLTQSSAILEYIADKYDMIPNCKKQRAVLHMLQNVVYDLSSSFGRVCYAPDFENLREPFVEGLPDILKVFEEYLGGKVWLTGDKINYPDFNLCEILNELEKFETILPKQVPKIEGISYPFRESPGPQRLHGLKGVQVSGLYGQYRDMERR